MKKIEALRKKANALPDNPGVYIMKNDSSEVIYIGKAKNLKNRVSQYFGSQNKHSVKVSRMVENVSDFDYIIVGSEFEALILECSLIKQYQPKYNILLKDDKGYSYVRFDDKGWKNISAVFQKEEDGAKYFGPYTSSDYVNTAVSEAADIYMLPHCNKIFPRDIKKSGRPCLNYYIKLCSGACCGKISKEEHNKNAEEALRFVLGGKNEIIDELKQQMNEAAENLEFEKAAKIRDKLKSIEKVRDRQHVVALKFENQDIFGVEHIGQKTCINILTVRDFRIVNTENFIIDRIEDDDEYVQIFTNYYMMKNDFPERILTDTNISSSPEFSEFLKSVKIAK